MRSRYSGAAIGGTGPISATLLAPGDDPPLGPSVKSQTLPATSAASPVGPAAACACVSVGKLSIRQNNGPAGNCLIFFSATGLTSNFWADAVEADNRDPDIATATHATRTRNDRRAILNIIRLPALRDFLTPALLHAKVCILDPEPCQARNKRSHGPSGSLGREKLAQRRGRL